MKCLKHLMPIAFVLALALAMPLTASAQVTAKLVDENHEPLTGAIDINVLESKKLILCLKGSSYDFQGANINLFDANDKRIEKAIEFWGGPISEAGHFDILLTIKPGTLKVGEKYSFKIDCVLKNDSANVVDSTTFTFGVGESSDDDSDDKKDDEDQDDSDDKKKDDEKKDDKKDDSKGNNGSGDDGGSGSGKDKGSSGKEGKGSAAGKADAKDDSDSSAVAPSDNNKTPVSSQEKEGADSSKKGKDTAQEQVDTSVLGAKGTVYSLGDGSSSAQGNTGGGEVPLFLEVTGIPWLLAVLIAVLTLALPAGAAKRIICAVVGTRRKSRLGDDDACR